MIKHLKISYTVQEALKLLSICRAAFYSEVNAGRLKSFVIPVRRRRVSARAIDDWIEASERATEQHVKTPLKQYKRTKHKAIYREANTARGAK